MAVFQTEVLDVGAAGLGDPQAVRHEQRDRRMLCQRPEPGGCQQRAEFVAVDRGVSLIVNPRMTDVPGWRVLEEFLFDRVLGEPWVDSRG